MYTFTKDCLIGIEAIDKEHEQLFKNDKRCSKNA